MKSKLPTISLLVLLSFLLTACTIEDLPLIGDFLSGLGLGSGPGQIVSGPVTLNMWGLWENIEVMESLIEDYTETKTNVTINYEDRSALTPLVSYKERVFSRLSEGGAPDIIRVHNSWVPSLARAGYLAPAPRSAITVDQYNEIFYPVAAESAVIDGNIYAIPLYYEGIALVYNRDHFAEVGQQSPPTAWEEFRRLARELTLYSGNELIRAGAAMGAVDNIDHFSDILGLMWSQAKVSIPEDLDGRNARDALTFYTNFLKEDRVWSRDFPEASHAFASGQVSMIFVPTWQILDILNASPGINMGVAPVPQVSPEEPAAWGTFWMEVVSAESANANAAWDFLAFLSEREQQLKFFNDSAERRGFGSPYARTDLAEELALNDYLRAYVQDAPYARSAEITARSGNRRQVDALREAVEAVLGGTNAETALTQAKAKIGP